MKLKGMRYMYHILVAGGDERNIYLAKLLSEENCKVSVCGFDNSVNFEPNIERVSDIKKSSSMSDLIILPLPVTKNNIILNTPYSSESIYISDILNYAKKGSVITGGRVNEGLASSVIDYSKRDDFSYLNSVPTAEGAIEAAMKESKKTIAGSVCMVTGFGKCAESLAHLLKAINAKVHIYARSIKDLSHASSLGFESYHISEIETQISRYDLIFNSVPFGIFNKECTDKINKNSVFIDIASAPGGIDCDVDKENINYHFLPGLPGKYSPYTAAEIIKKVILTIVRESGKDALRWL